MFDTRLSATQELRLAELYEAHAPSVLRLCRRMLGNPQDAADACQEVFIRAAHSASSLPPRPWLLTVARNYCLDQIRRQKRFNTAINTLGADWSGGADPESSVVDRDTVDGIFKQLSQRERSVLWQSAVERRPLAEIANGLRLNYMAAGQVVSRARRHAFTLAMKVAAIFVGLRVITRRVTAMPVKLVAAAVVPVAALSVQSSSSTVAGQPPSFGGSGSSTVSTYAAVSGARSSGTNAAAPRAAVPGLTVPGASPLVTIPPVPVPTATVGLPGSVTGTVSKVFPPLPSPPALPTPSLPPPPPLP